MNTNFIDALKEARRLLKVDGILRIAEVESRFEGGPDAFPAAVEAVGFKQLRFDNSHKVFWMFEFKAVAGKSSSILPNADGSSDKPVLKPCLYKKR
mgnify:CR=1 FL=1